MKTDRELLELAAKAAGVKLYSGNFYDDQFGHTKEWNPLRDDGDALRLAVKLRMVVQIFDDVVAAFCLSGQTKRESREPDIYAATRRAIVRAAAEIGKVQS